MLYSTLAGPCPDFNTFNVTVDPDTFCCAHIWQGWGSVDPGQACNPLCAAGGFAEGTEVPQDHYFTSDSGS